MHPHYGFSITAKRIGTREPGIFISGLALERGAIERILPFKMGDYAPVWEGGVEPYRIIVMFESMPGGESYLFELVNIRASIEEGGPASQHPFRGVDGWTIPPVIRGPGESQWRPSRPGNDTLRR